MTSIDDMAANLNFTTAKTGADKTVTFLPEPERAARRYTVISVDDHIVEPPDTFEGRGPAKFADRGIDRLQWSGDRLFVRTKQPIQFAEAADVWGTAKLEAKEWEDFGGPDLPSEW